MSNFSPRLTAAGIYRNPKWYAKNPFEAAGYGLPNCTTYAWGRAWEIEGQRPRLPLGDAGTWYDEARRAGIYKTGSVPALGAVICWGKTGGAGHVAVVEEIHADGSLTTSNSGWYRPISDYPPDTPNYFYTNRTSRDYMEPWMDSRYFFQGFIYIDRQPEPPKPGKIPVWLLFKIRK